MNDKITTTNENIVYNGTIEKLPPVKSKITIGNLTIFNTKKFNWFQKKMIKLVFGIKIEDYKGDE